MKRLILNVILLTACAFTFQTSIAQDSKLDSLFIKGDSTRIMDSLMKDFMSFVDSIAAPKSFLSINLGVGNRSFSVNNNSLNAQESSTKVLSFTPSIGYYHKSGLGISITGFVSAIGNNPELYQYAITPSYDYISKKLSAGISYTRYTGKKDAIESTSPYDNDVYGYFNIHHKKWRYGVSAGYATGSFSDILSYKDSVLRLNPLTNRIEWFRYTVTTESMNHIKDFSLAASVRKDFEWYNVLNKHDNLTLSITGYLVSGSSSVSTNTNLNVSTRRKITLARFKRSYASQNGNNFQFQSTALSLSLFYTIGKFNLQPIWFMDYYFPDTETHFSQVFSLTVGFNF
jgi:hypothetical protein